MEEFFRLNEVEIECQLAELRIARREKDMCKYRKAMKKIMDVASACNDNVYESVKEGE